MPFQLPAPCHTHPYTHNRIGGGIATFAPTWHKQQLAAETAAAAAEADGAANDKAPPRL